MMRSTRVSLSGSLCCSSAVRVWSRASWSYSSSGFLCRSFSPNSWKVRSYFVFTLYTSLCFQVQWFASQSFTWLLLFSHIPSSPPCSSSGGTDYLLSVFAPGVCSLLEKKPDLSSERHRNDDICWTGVRGPEPPTLCGDDSLHGAMWACWWRCCGVPIHVHQPCSLWGWIYPIAIVQSKLFTVGAEGAAKIIFFLASPQHAASDVTCLQTHRSQPWIPTFVSQAGTLVQNK